MFPSARSPRFNKAKCKQRSEFLQLILVFNKAPFSGGEKKLLNKCTYENFTAWTVEIESISAAMENMLLIINDLELGGVWVSDLHIARKEIKKYTKCNYDFVAAIAFGYPKYKLLPRKALKFNLKIVK